MATHKKRTPKNPTGDPVYLEPADIYLKMGLREEALAHYRILLRQYKTLGMKDKTLKVMALMAKMDPSKTDLEKKITDLEHLLNLKNKMAGNAPPEEPGIVEEGFGPEKKEPYFDLGAELTKLEPRWNERISENRIGRERVRDERGTPSSLGLCICMDRRQNYNI